MSIGEKTYSQPDYKKLAQASSTKKNYSNKFNTIRTKEEKP